MTLLFCSLVNCAAVCGVVCGKLWRSSVSMARSHRGAVGAGGVGDEVHPVFALPERRACQRARDREVGEQAEHFFLQRSPRSSTSPCAGRASAPTGAAPRLRWWALANFFVTIVPPRPSAASVAAEPCSHSILYILPNDSGSIAVIRLSSSITGAPGCARSRTRPLVKAIARHCAHAVDCPQRRRHRGGDAPLTLRVLHDQVAREGAADSAVDRRLGAGGEHRDEGDQPQPDGQRERGDERAAGLADRVLAREAGGDPAPAHQPADRSGERRHDAVVAGGTLAGAPQPRPQTPAAHGEHHQNQ